MKHFAVIGMGNFGQYLSQRLYEMGHDVLAIDKNSVRIQLVKNNVSRAVVADAADRRAMEALGVQRVDVAIVCIGTVLSDSILVTLNLKDLGVNRILAKAISEAHGRILFKVGAAEIIFPEKDLAISVAERLHNPNMLDYLPFMEGYSIMELSPPQQFIGKTLKDLDLINRYGIQVVAIREIVPDRLNMVPTGNSVIKDSDILILLGPNEKLSEVQSEARAE